jgi:hypothetical protein
MLKLNLKDLKLNMWIEVCNGEEKEFSDEYKELVSGIGDEEVSGVDFIINFYKILDKLIDNELIEFEGGDYDWIYNELSVYGEENNFDKYIKEYNNTYGNIEG